MLPGQQSLSQQQQLPQQQPQRPYTVESAHSSPDRGIPTAAGASPDRADPAAGASPQQAQAAPGQLVPAPSSHFISTDSLDESGNLGDLAPGMGSQPLELTEGELEDTPDSTFTTPRQQWGSLYGGGVTARSTGGAGTALLLLPLSIGLKLGA